MKKHNYLSIIMVCTLLFFGSCEKIVTENEKGKATTKSSLFTIQYYQWMEDGNSGDEMYGYYVSLPCPDITDDVINNGLVMAYMKVGDAYAALPFILTLDGYEKTFEYLIRKEEVLIYVFDSDLFTLAPSGAIEFRIVIINNFSSLRKTEEEIKNLEYEEVILLNQNDLIR